MTWQEIFKRHSTHFETRRGGADFILTQDAIKFTQEILDKMVILITDIESRTVEVNGYLQETKRLLGDTDEQ